MVRWLLDWLLYLEGQRPYMYNLPYAYAYALTWDASLWFWCISSYNYHLHTSLHSHTRHQMVQRLTIQVHMQHVGWHHVLSECIILRLCFQFPIGFLFRYSPLITRVDPCRIRKYNVAYLLTHSLHFVALPLILVWLTRDHSPTRFGAAHVRLTQLAGMLDTISRRIFKSPDTSL
jgi:hypothetical protein